MPFKLDIRTILINVITALGLIFLLEGLLSLGLRFPAYIPKFLVPYFSEYYKGNDRNILQVTDCAQWDGQLFYKMNTGACRFANREFDTMTEFNSAGLRDDEQSLSNPDVVALGDSFTMGWGTNDNECYPEVLEQKTGLKVLNAGVSSFGTAREMILLKKLGLQNIPTLIIQYHWNDYDENKSFEDNDYRLPIRSRTQYDSLKKVIHDRNQYYPLKYVYGISKEFAKSLVANKKNAPETVQAKTFLDILIHSKVNEIASNIIVVKIEAMNEMNDGFLNAVDSLLTTPAYAGKIQLKTQRLQNHLGRDDYFILDDHTNARGHAKIANILAPLVKQHPIVVAQQP